jgi:hypothetical protein
MTISIKGTLKFTAIVCAACMAATLPLASSGLWPPFAGGLLCGAGASVAGFTVVYRFTERAVAASRVGVAFTGLGLRLVIYFVVMAAVTALFGMWSGIGAAAGCLVCPAAIIVQVVALPKLRKLRGVAPYEEDRRYVYEPHLRDADGALRYVFIRGSYRERASGGRVYVTHRRFRKLAAVRGAQDGKARRS